MVFIVEFYIILFVYNRSVQLYQCLEWFFYGSKDFCEQKVALCLRLSLCDLVSLRIVARYYCIMPRPITSQQAKGACTKQPVNFESTQQSWQHVAVSTANQSATKLQVKSMDHLSARFVSLMMIMCLL